ncbi:unnamed protein product [Polarella glacialis]|uniref:Uncharacterized protein n=1 Tax=Polarella glacialis TaxID=89957 RepID=A0A813HX56_POLGL|nr:unnamed protein product [Polarella glacialis]
MAGYRMKAEGFAEGCQRWRLVSALVGMLLARPTNSIGQTAKERPPLSDVDPTTIYQKVLRSGAAAPGAALQGVAAPLPTNAWWQNVAQVAVPGSQEGNIFLMPYIVLAEPAGLSIMQPFQAGTAGQQVFDAGLVVRLGAANAALLQLVLFPF